MSNLNDLTIIIVTYKTKDEILFDCINSIKKEIKIINVENSNNTSHKNKIEKKYSNVKVILSGKNLGYGSANNLGLKNSKTRYVLISNPDVEHNKDFFDEINFYLKGDTEFSIIGPSYNDEKTHSSYGSLDGSTIAKEFDKFFLKEVGYVIGCSMLLDTKNIKTNSYFDENFFLYFEEADLCRRVKTKGGKVFCSSKLFITHLGNKGSTSTDPKYEIESEMMRSWHWMWSTFYYHKKHSSYLNAFSLMYGKLVRAFFKMIIFSLFYNKKKQKMYYARLSGLFSAMIGKKSSYRIKSLE
jgi:GT2 family glycosyltransferase